MLLVGRHRPDLTPDVVAVILAEDLKAHGVHMSFFDAELPEIAGMLAEVAVLLWLVRAERWIRWFCLWFFRNVWGIPTVSVLPFSRS